MNEGLPDGLRPAHMEGGCDLYTFYGNVLQLFIAVSARTLALIHLSKMGKEYEEAQALTRAIERMREHFGL